MNFRKEIAAALIGLLIGTIIGCTNQGGTRAFAGKVKIELEAGRRLVNIAWRNNNLWILTEVAPEQVPVEYEFKEYPALDVIAGMVIIKEK